MNSSRHPLILLLFANAYTGDLSSVAKERHELLQLLRSEIDKNALDIEVDSIDYTTIDGVLKALNLQQDRLAILHFAGHSGTDLLQLDEGKAHARGIAAKLGACPNLKLVFLNGCNNTELVKAIASEKVPAVIGTRKPVMDKAALRFSKGFFNALAVQQKTLAESWVQAKSDAESETEDHYRSLDIKQPANTPEWAWFIESRISDWRLLDVAHPCNRLPSLSIDSYPLPNEPFKGLRSYTELDAAIFFGRCSDSLAVLHELNKPERIFILQGRSGAGKTSFIQAGLIPYLKTRNEEIYFCDAHQLPETGSLKEKNILILDHAERLFPHEAGKLKEIAKTDFDKIIFSVRTEWFGELTDQLHNKLCLTTNNYLLKPLSENQINEVFAAVAKLKDTKYRLELQNPEHGTLSELIINDIKSDPDSATAPILQLLLKNIYDDIKNNERRIINIEGYEKFRQKGLGIIPQVKEKLKVISQKNPSTKQAYDSGLLIDILHAFTTEYNTSKSIKKTALKTKYQHISYIDQLLTSLEDELLIQTFYDEQDKVHYTKLAHGSLSKYIKIIYSESSLPGQLARREINHLKRSWTEEYNNTRNLIDPRKLSTVEQGLVGTYDIHADETEVRLLVQSKAARRKSKKQKLLIATAFLVLISPFIYLLINFNTLTTELDLDEAHAAYRTLKLHFKNNNQSSDDYIKDHYQEVIRKLLEVDNELIQLAANKPLKYAGLQDIYLILAVIEFRSTSKNTDHINKLARQSERLGSDALEILEQISLPEAKPKNDVLFNLLYAGSMQVCTGAKPVESIQPILDIVDKKHLEATITPNDHCLIDTLAKVK